MVRNYISKTQKWRDVRVRLAKYGISPRDFAMLCGITSDHMHAILYGETRPDNRIMAILSLMGQGGRKKRGQAISILRSHEPEWRHIPFYSRYEASEDGRIRRGLNELVLCRDSTFYYKVTLFNDDKKQMRMSVHRAVAMAFHGMPEPPRICACHKNGDPLDNRAENLYWGTHKDNSDDRTRHGRSGRLWGKPSSPPKLILVPKEEKDYGKRVLIPGIGYAKKA